ncbi:MAG: hypothetical protein D6772_03055 [Bacteroidetes bacterium]|nr:MAG: hypothetical protein D6772_03055 [Bacteroidota bacterium]
MQVIAYTGISEKPSGIDEFLDAFFIRQMNYLASDLLQEGLWPEEIASALARAIRISEAANLDVRRHFAPVYTQINQQIMKDCRLSRLAYGLVLLNARPDRPVVAQWQLKLLRQFFEAS